jgi:hypothetical protein
MCVADICAQIRAIGMVAHGHLVMEYPTYQAGMRGKLAAIRGDTLKLAFLCGYLVAKITAQKVYLATPIEWKGNVPKAVTQERLRAKGYKFTTPDEADALALGLWFIQSSHRNA